MYYLLECIGLFAFIVGACSIDGNVGRAVAMMLIGGFIFYGSYQLEKDKKK